MQQFHYYVCAQEMWKHVHTKAYASMFTAALFRIQESANIQMSFNWWMPFEKYGKFDEIQFNNKKVTKDI